MILYDTLKPEDKEKRLYKELTGKDYVPPKRDLREIDRLMKENKGVWHE